MKKKAFMRLTPFFSAAQLSRTYDFLRHYRDIIGFFVMTLCCVGALLAILHMGTSSIDKTMAWIDRSNLAIDKTQEMLLRVERMQSARRSHLLSGGQNFEDMYEVAKSEVSDLIAELSLTFKEDPAQASRLEELQHHFLNYAEKLGKLSPTEAAPIQQLQDSVKTDTDKQNIIRVGQDVTLQAQKALGQHMITLESQRNNIRIMLTGMLLLSGALLVIFHAYVWRSRSAQRVAEKLRDDTAEMFRLAIEGASDGIFDWDLLTGEAEYSKQFWSMLGYDLETLPSTMQAFKDAVHPEDLVDVEADIGKYLSGEKSDYKAMFRMRHKSGRWIWVNARGRAMYDDQGMPYRMVGAHTDISAMKAYEEKLEKSKEMAEKASRAKTEFLAHMSHEIRTPLTAISGIAEIFEALQEGLSDKQRQLVRTLNSSTASLRDLVNDILDFSKIESSEVVLEDQVFELRAVFEQVISILSIKSGEKGISFRFDYTDVSGRKFRGDRVRLRQVLINLIGNAIKFTDKGGVTVRAWHEPPPPSAPRERNGNVLTPALLCIEVRDTGIGIDPAHFGIIFEQFKQADSSVSRKYGGTGLGLPISRRLANLMGGDIHVESNLGKGSVFTLRVPLTIDEVIERDSAGRAGKLADAGEDPGQRHNFGKKKVLLVEDYEGNIVLLGYLLDEMGLAHDVARTGAQAMDLWRESGGGYDLILMDVQMPEMDGFTATEGIRRIEAENSLVRTPIVGMTAHALVGDRERCIDAGMDAYLPKPIDEHELKAKIVEYLKKPARKSSAA